MELWGEPQSLDQQGRGMKRNALLLKMEHWTKAIDTSALDSLFCDIMTDVYHLVQHGQHHAWLSPISNLLASPKIKNKTGQKSKYSEFSVQLLHLFSPEYVVLLSCHCFSNIHGFVYVVEEDLRAGAAKVGFWKQRPKILNLLFFTSALLSVFFF